MTTEAGGMDDGADDGAGRERSTCYLLTMLRNDRDTWIVNTGNARRRTPIGCPGWPSEDEDRYCGLTPDGRCGGRAVSWLWADA